MQYLCTIYIFRLCAMAFSLEDLEMVISKESPYAGKLLFFLLWNRIFFLKRFIYLAYKMLQVKFRSFVARIDFPENVQNCLGKMATNGEGF